MQNRSYVTLGVAIALTSSLLAAHCGKCIGDSCPACFFAINNPNAKLKTVKQQECSCKENCSCKKMSCTLCKKKNCPCLTGSSVKASTETNTQGNPGNQQGVAPIIQETINLGGGTSTKPGKTSHIIELPANPSTGHRWVIAQQDLPKGTQVIMGNVTYKEPEAQGQIQPVIVGAPGTIKIEIIRGEVGKGTLRLDYVGPDKQIKKSNIYTIITHHGLV